MLLFVAATAFDVNSGVALTPSMILYLLFFVTVAGVVMIAVDPGDPYAIRIRRLITVESGLNDGIATPVVVVAIAGAASAKGLHGVGPGEALLELAAGVVVGVAAGAAGGGLLRWAQHRGWTARSSPESRSSLSPSATTPVRSS